MQTDYSKQSLFRFITTASKQGLFNANTAVGLKAAVTALLEDIGDSDDVRKIDVDAATMKYHNKHPGELTPGSLRTYENRTRRVLQEFVKYSADPAAYKPKSRRVAKANNERGERADAPRIKVGVRVKNPVPEQHDEHPAGKPALPMYYPLRESFVAQVVLPRDMTNDEARRICAFIRTLAVDFVPED